MLAISVDHQNGHWPCCARQPMVLKLDFLTSLLPQPDHQFMPPMSKAVTPLAFEIDKFLAIFLFKSSDI
jgi:hypothetical protein